MPAALFVLREKGEDVPPYLTTLLFFFITLKPGIE